MTPAALFPANRETGFWICALPREERLQSWVEAKREGVLVAK